MPEPVKIALVLTYAYLIGSIPMAYILGRVLKGIDIREYGSGNVGASNVWVHVNKKIVIPLGAFDLFVKGASPVWLARYGLDLGLGPQALAGLATVAGHNWSLYLGFTGGRGIGTAIGVLFALGLYAAPGNTYPVELIAFALVALGGVLVFRSSALWVGIALFLLPLWALILGRPLALVLFCVGLLVVVAAKRVLGNWAPLPTGSSAWQVAMCRLLFDRDVFSRDEWVYRKPPKGEEPSRS